MCLCVRVCDWPISTYICIVSLSLSLTGGGHSQQSNLRSSCDDFDGFVSHDDYNIFVASFLQYLIVFEFSHQFPFCQTKEVKQWWRSQASQQDPETVAPEADDTVLRYSPSKKMKKEIQSHPVVRDYNYHFNGVDHKDRDTADWSISMKSNKFYFRIFYWNFDSVIHCGHNVVKDVVDIAKKKAAEAAKTAGETAKKAAKTVVDFWCRYTEPILGRYRFQMDAGIALINKGLTMDWDWNNPTKVECRPKYVRHIDWFPCDCPDDDSKQLRCFFCKHGFTHGVAHKQEEVSEEEHTINCKDCMHFITSEFELSWQMLHLHE